MSSEGNGRKIPLAALAGAGVSLLALLAIRRKLLAKRKAKKKAPPEVDQVKRGPVCDAATAKLFHGVRVLEVATHVAAPTVSRIMADLGAEVIKVESPGGDLFRKTLLAFEQPRRFGTMFEGQNLGKSSIVLDLKSEQGIAALKRLLRGADVLITNTRNRSLIDLGLTYDQLKKEFPKLIFAQVSAWGLQGPDKDLPGYDVGAFWAGSGAAVYTNEAGNYDTYTGALGDFTTGQFLLAGVGLALRERLSTGRGRKVETSLLHCGVWCMSPHVVNAAAHDETARTKSSPDYSKIPPKKIVDAIYQTKDDKPLVVSFVGSTQDEKRAEDELRDLLQLAAEQLSYEAVGKAMLDRTHEEVVRTLQSAKLLHVSPLVSIGKKWEEMAKFSVKQESPSLHRQVFDVPPGDYAKEVPCIPKIPYEFSCSQHKPCTRAPDLGAHSQDVLEREWLSDETLSRDSHSSLSPSNEEQRLAGVVVVELCDVAERHDVAVASTGALLASFGATVYKIEVESESDGFVDPLKAYPEQTHAQFQNRKTRRDLAELPSLIAEADVLLTDIPAAKLESIGVDIERLREKHDKLVVVRMVGSVDEEHLSAFTAAFARSGTATIYAGVPATNFPRYPDQFLELIGSAFMLAAVMSALYYRDSKQTGQVVTVSYERLGLWLAQLSLVFGLRDPKLQSFLVRDNLKSKFRSLLPTYTSRKTKDGVWLQLLGLETKRHLGRTLAALGVKYRTYAGMFVAGVCRVLPRFAMGSGSTIHKVEPLFECINRNIISGFAAQTFEEIQASFAEHGVWHAPFRMPSELRNYEQVIANNIIVEKGGNIEVLNPITIT